MIFRILGFICLCVNGQMTESPLQFKLGHEFLKDILKSAKSDILQVYDNLTIYPEDGAKYFDYTLSNTSEGIERKILIEEFTFSSKNSLQRSTQANGMNRNNYNFVMDVEFDEQNNYIKFIIPDNLTSGESAKFEAEAEVY